MAWYWKEIEDRDSAEDATKAAVGISYFVAGLTALLSVFKYLLQPTYFRGERLVLARCWSVRADRVADQQAVAHVGVDWHLSICA